MDLKVTIENFNQKLEKINDNKKESIAAFIKASDLVRWMRTALPGNCILKVVLKIPKNFRCVINFQVKFVFTGGIKDLKIYADLALLSVEGDEHVGRVTKLHSAAIGYSTAIFSTFNGEQEMIDTWKEVWQNLEKDTSLPKKLVIGHTFLS